MRAEPRVGLVALAAGVAAVALLFALLPSLPFQDLPNHVLLLRADQALRAGRSLALLEPARAVVFGYSLTTWIGRALVGMCTLGGAPDSAPELALRVTLLVAAVATPLAVAGLARVAGTPAAWSGLLALPLALSWPMRMGFVSYVFAVPLGLGAVAALIAQSRRPRAVTLVALSLLVTLTYLAHALVFASLLATVAIGWLTLGAASARGAVRLLLAVAPALLLTAHDLAAGGFDQVAGTEVTWPPSPIEFRGGAEALAHVLTRSWGLTGPRSLPLFLPYLVALSAGILAAARRTPGPRRAPAPEVAPVGRFLVAAALTTVVASLLMPLSRKTVWEIGPRIPMIAMALVITIGAQGVAGWRKRWRIGAGAAITLWLTVGVVELAGRSARIEAITATSAITTPPTGRASLGGRYLTARLADCPAAIDTGEWGRYDPERHLWAHAMSADGTTPYLFAFSRYLPVWFRADRYPWQLAARPDWDTNAVWSAVRPADCAAQTRRRIADTVQAATRDGYDGAIFVGMPDRIDGSWPVMQQAAGGGALRRIAGGMALVTPR